ncbi:protein MNN4-like [Osmia bicornis bicornis]|uniref:protein MNN4-like n=1 Tax=Osmia bicornis bicornis TaxID=1437191 RepID=UPI001EAF66CC|nr:protein MNN4-like [Osmia bicornis bicornis]
MAYGAEIWGWKERKEMEGVQERILKRTLGVDWCTPGYMIREETQRSKVSLKAGRLAWGFERRMLEGRGGELARKCLEEIIFREQRERPKSKWEEERKKFFEERGIEQTKLEEKRRRREMGFEEIEEADIRMQEKERWDKILEARYNKWYKEIKEKGMPKYLEKGWKEERWKRVARFRMGNEINGAKYWESEEKRKCRICEWEQESWEHVWEGCGTSKERKEGWQEIVKVLQGEDGEGERWMKEMEKEKETGERQRRSEREGAAIPTE